MIICKVWDAEYPWDVRVEKVTRTLRAGGHEVHIVARNRDGRPVREELPEGVVHRLAPLAHGGARLNAVSMFPVFFNPRWYRRILQVARDESAELILCRDLPLAPTCVAVARRLAVPVVVDMAEDYPAMLAQLYNRRDFRIHNLLVRNPYLAAALERYVLARIDGVLVVTEETASRYRALGMDPDRITIVGNTPLADRVERMPYDRPSRDPGAPLSLVYLGLLEPARGVEFLLQAVTAANADGTRVTVDFFGTDPGGQWEERAAAAGAAGTTRFHGFVDYDDVLMRLHEFDVGVMPHHISRHIQTTLPNKLYDYMAAGLPVLSSDAKPVARLLAAEGCGMVFRDSDQTDFSACCDRLSDPQLRGRMGQAGRNAVERRLNWDADGRSLLEFLATCCRAPDATAATLNTSDPARPEA